VFGFGSKANSQENVPTGIPMSEADFNAIWKRSPNQILRWECVDCSGTSKIARGNENGNVYMRRYDTDNDLPFDMLELILQNWSKNPNNTLGTDFDLFSNYNDAVDRTNAWTFCSYGIGFPRDCGPAGFVGGWSLVSINRYSGQTMNWRAKDNFIFYVETPTPTDSPTVSPPTVSPITPSDFELLTAGPGICPSGKAVTQEECFDAAKEQVENGLDVIDNGFDVNTIPFYVGTWNNTLPCGCSIYSILYASDAAVYYNSQEGSCSTNAGDVYYSLVCRKTTAVAGDGKC
jgi:hypothetical protein